MLQCTLTSRAQEAYLALSVSDRQKYALVKAYKLVPEAYCQCFRMWKKTDNQTHLEFASDLTGHFTRWCSVLKIETFDDLCELIVLEQFINSIPESIAQHNSDHKVKGVNEAVALADDYVLTHKCSFGEVRTYSTNFGERADPGVVSYTIHLGKPDTKERSVRGFEKSCNYSHRKGHLKADCYALKVKAKQTGPVGQPKGACCTVPITHAPTVQMESVKKNVTPIPGELESFLPFVSDDHVSLVGSGDSVPVKILHDAAAFDSFIQASVLPYSEESHTGCCVPVFEYGNESFAGPVAQNYAPF